MSSALIKLKRCNIILTIILVLDVIALLMLGISRATANLWSNEEVWVDENNKSQVEEYVASLNFPQDNIVRVVYIPGLGDGEAVVYYKNTTLSTGGRYDCYSEIFTQYGETEGTRTAYRVCTTLLAILVVVFIGKKIVGMMIEYHSDSPVTSPHSHISSCLY